MLSGLQATIYIMYACRLTSLQLGARLLYAPDRHNSFASLHLGLCLHMYNDLETKLYFLFEKLNAVENACLIAMSIIGAACT